MELKIKIQEQADKQKHFPLVFRVAKWGKIEEKAFYSTMKEVDEGILPDKYDRNDIGSYSTSVYITPDSCRKYIRFLKGRIRKLYPCPMIIQGKTSGGLVQKTQDRNPKYEDLNHIDWWIFQDMECVVMQNFEEYEEETL